MRIAAWVLAGIVLGFLLGGVEPRRALSALQDEKSAVEDQLIKAQRKASKCGRRIVSPVPGLDEAFAPAMEPEPGSQEDEAHGGLEIEVNGPGEDEEAATASDAAREGPNADPMREFDLAADAQKVRAAQARQALIEQADLDEEGVAKLDEVVTRMNEQLADHAEELLALSLSMQDGDEPTPRELLGFTHDVTGILYESQVQLEEVAGPEAVADADESTLQVWNYVDLEYFRGATEEALAVPPAPSTDDR